MIYGRVLIVDDSVVVRRLVADVLKASVPDLAVDVAATASIALNKIAVAPPDVIILDVEMPDMSGLEALPRLRAAAPRAKVVMFSSLTRKGAAASLDALALGAVDCVVKPASMKNLAESTEILRIELVSRVAALLPRRPSSVVVPVVRSAGVAPRGPRPMGPVELVAVGASTGGPNALAEVLGALAGFPVPVVMVQHMPALFTRMLADRLAQRGTLKVVEASDGDVLAPGGAWLAPGGQHLTVERRGATLVARLSEDPPENFCRPSVDVLLRSVVRCCGSSALAVILTGMGGDGMRGCGTLRQAGGQVIVQDQATSVVWGMPGQVVAAGYADEVLPISEIGAAMVRIAGDRRAGARTTGVVPVVQIRRSGSDVQS